MKAITIWSVILFGVSCTLLYAFSGLFMDDKDKASEDKMNENKIEEKGVVHYESMLFSPNKSKTFGKSSIHVSHLSKH